MKQFLEDLNIIPPQMFLEKFSPRGISPGFTNWESQKVKIT